MQSNQEKFNKKLKIGEMSNENRKILEKLIKEYKDIFEYNEEKIR